MLGFAAAMHPEAGDPAAAEVAAQVQVGPKSVGSVPTGTFRLGTTPCQASRNSGGSHPERRSGRRCHRRHIWPCAQNLIEAGFSGGGAFLVRRHGCDLGRRRIGCLRSVGDRGDPRPRRLAQRVCQRRSRAAGPAIRAQRQRRSGTTCNCATTLPAPLRPGVDLHDSASSRRARAPRPRPGVATLQRLAVFHAAHASSPPSGRAHLVLGSLSTASVAASALSLRR